MAEAMNRKRRVQGIQSGSLLDFIRPVCGKLVCMHRLFFVIALTLALSVAHIVVCADDGGTTPSAATIDISETDWPWWRGPDRNGIAAADQTPPTSWSESEHVLWKTSIPGRGHGSPIVVGDQVILATADSTTQTQSVLCFNRKTGDQLWQTVVHSGGLATKGNGKSTQASSTIACDGDRFFVNFLNDDAVYTTALSRTGEQLWQKKITSYVVHQGYGSSPAVYGPLVIVSADNKGGGAIAALDRATGREVWKHRRPQEPNYASPIILPVAGREQLLFTGCDLVSSFDPLSGDKLWEIAGSTTECVTSTVTDGELIFTSGGYPRNHMSAVRADGSGEIVWENGTRVYVPSMLVRDGSLYAVTDAGVAMCWECQTGKEVWKGRLGGKFTASPVMVGDHIYATDEQGRTSIFSANPKAFQLVAQNQLGDEAMATPTICGGRIYMRVAYMDDESRHETLYCLGE